MCPSPPSSNPNRLHRLSAVLLSPIRIIRWMGNTLCSRRKVDRSTQFGLSVSSSRAKARDTFVTAVRRVIHLLKLRRRWAAYGRILQESPRKDLWTGLERRAGILTRIRKAPVSPQAAARPKTVKCKRLTYVQSDAADHYQRKVAGSLSRIGFVREDGDQLRSAVSGPQSTQD